MAAVSAQARRRRQATYGKPSRSVSTWNSGNLDALDEDELAIAEPTISRNTTLTKSYSIQKRDTKTIAPKSKAEAGKKREIKQDVWDVPSSESSEDEVSPARKQPAPKFGGKGKSNRVEETAQLAPWEKTKAQVLSPSRRNDLRKSTLGPPIAAEEDGRLEGVHDAMPMAGVSSEVVNDKEMNTSPVHYTPNVSSAAARLQARRLQSGQSITTGASKAPQPPKRVQDGNRAIAGPRKRLRSSKMQDNDVVMGDMPPPRCDSPKTSDELETSLKDTSNHSDSGAEHLSIAAARTTNTKAAPALQTRRGKLTTYSSPRKMESAPARLSEMLPVDTDNTDDTRSPSITTSRPATPQKSGDTSHPSSPQTAFKTGAKRKQSQLLDRLMAEEGAAPSPSALPMHALNIDSARRRFGTTAALPRTMIKSSSDVGLPRTKLVDRLKASARSSDEESSSDDPTDGSDVEMNEADDREAATSQQSQSQSQLISTNNKPKFTYAATQITWLKEESLEEELMLDMSTEAYQRPVASPRRALERTNSASQKSPFDFDDSDEDDGAAGRLRTIHELRAGGVNQRFVDDISGLLEDAANHKTNARSRRRSALMEISTKLADKAFAAKFFRQGFEQQLMAECAAASDDIADFALATAVVVLMSGDPPEHLAESLKTEGVLTLLSRMLHSRTDPRKLARERRNNMSKAAQSHFSGFVTHITQQQSIWKALAPTAVTLRTISLKALDLLVGRLRRSGDRLEILSSDQIQAVLPSQQEIGAIRSGEVTADTTLAVSVLESLSTTTVSISWPADLIETLRTLLDLPVAIDERSQHLRFLTLRLCLNLTNGNHKNCKAFARPDTVVALLQAMSYGFEVLFQDQEESQRTINLDLLVLSMGIMINLTEQKSSACEYAATKEAAPLLSTLVEVFLRGQQRTFEAESVEDGVTNVAFGYLAVVLANLCRNREARQIVSTRLPGEKLTTLVEAVHEFVVHHQKVDALNFEGEEGTAVWSAFTEKLKAVLSRLSAEAEADEIDGR